ncbi:purine nucleoside phosphorylase LACC1-like [Branchiostoma lanceolatum]|uniref:purine nucleoside phosphorylase LACC1-like n=1 Tax=Branchiostoma lanceolatum TaxID=7740 RepID=UPI003453B160
MMDNIKKVFHAKCEADKKGKKCISVVTTPEIWEKVKPVYDLLFTKAYEIETVFVEDPGGTYETSSERELHVQDASPELPITDSHVSDFLRQIPSKGTVSPMVSAIVPDIFYHGFSTRSGGLSLFSSLSSLNLNFNPNRRDPRVVVQENRYRLAAACGFDVEKLYIAKAEHGSRVWVVGKDPPDAYDAIVTNSPGVTIAAPGADCIPMLFADPVNQVVGAAHSGWRGTLAGVAAETLRAMAENFGTVTCDVLAVLGPSIGPCCFEVGEDVAEKFAAVQPACVVREEGKVKPTIDLRKVSRLLLEQTGVKPENIDDGTQGTEATVTLCTACEPEQRFFSYRRDGAQFGTQVGFIGIKGAE